MKINTLKDLGTLIRQRRKRERMTIDMLAAMLPCSPRLLGELERGVRNVSFEQVLAVCAMLGIELTATGREESI